MVALRASFLFFFLFNLIAASFAQAEIEFPPPGSVIGSDGRVYFDFTIGQKGFAAMQKNLGEALDDGWISSEEACDALMNQLPGGFLRGIASVGAFFGICPSESDRVKESLKNEIYPLLISYCMNLSGIYETTFSAHGEEFPGVRVVSCEWKDPGIEHSCDGLKELCMMSEFDAGIRAPDASANGQLMGSLKIPGCECSSVNIFDPTNPISHEHLSPLESISLLQ
jgi:hypothetical protein